MPPKRSLAGKNNGAKRQKKAGGPGSLPLGQPSSTTHRSGDATAHQGGDVSNAFEASNGTPAPSGVLAVPAAEERAPAFPSVVPAMAPPQAPASSLGIDDDALLDDLASDNARPLATSSVGIDDDVLVDTFPASSDVPSSSGIVGTPSSEYMALALDDSEAQSFSSGIDDDALLDTATGLETPSARGTYALGLSPAFKRRPWRLDSPVAILNLRDPRSPSVAAQAALLSSEDDFEYPRALLEDIPSSPVSRAQRALTAARPADITPVNAEEELRPEAEKVDLDAGTVLAAVQKAASRGAEIELSLFAVLVHSYSVLIVWAERALDKESYENLLELGADGLADLSIKGMREASPELADYIDECMRCGVPHDVRKVVEILEEVSMEIGIYTHGLYLIRLLKKEIYLYGGSSSDLHRQGLWSRMNDHLDLAHRQKVSNMKKPLYRLWDGGHRSGNLLKDALVRPFLVMDKTYVARHGADRLLAMETVLTLLLCGWHFKAAEAILGHGLDLSCLIPGKLADAYVGYAAQQGCTDIHGDRSNLSILNMSMSLVAGLKVYGYNWALPLWESRNKAMPLQALKAGSRVKICRWSKDLYGFGLGQISISVVNKANKKLLDEGISLDRPYVVATISRSDEYAEDNWATVKELSNDVAEPLRSELIAASRTRMSITFVDEEGATKTRTISSGYSSINSLLDRVCKINTLYEFADGTLPNDKPFQGRWRRDPWVPLAEQPDKVWAKDSPEVLALDPRRADMWFSCVHCGTAFGLSSELAKHRTKNADCREAWKAHEKAADEWTKSGKNKFRCFAPGCKKYGTEVPYECVQWGSMIIHLGVGRHERTTGMRCASAINITTTDDAKARIKEFMIPGVPFGESALGQLFQRAPKTDGEQEFACKGDACGFQSDSVAIIRKHLLLKNTPGPSANVTAKKEKCRDAFGINDQSVRSDVTADMCRNPNWTG